jgi:hypothetical protein
MPKRKRDEVPVDFVSRFPGFARLAGTVALPAQQPAAVAVQELTITFVGKKCPMGMAHTSGAQGTFTPRLHPDGTPLLHQDGTPRLAKMCDDCAEINRKRSRKYKRARSSADQCARRAKRVAYEIASLGDLVDLTGGRSPPHP